MKQEIADAPGAGGASPAFAVRLRGLPWSATKQEICEFLENRPDESSVIICLGRDGRPSGEALVGLYDSDSFELAKSKHKENLGRRYVEVYESSTAEYMNCSYDNDDGDASGFSGYEFIVKMRGMPFSATDHDIRDFFDGCSISPGGIVICLGQNGSANGEALVQFDDKESADQALERHKKNMGQR